MKSLHREPLDAALAILGTGLVLGLLARVIENSPLLAGILGH